MEQPKDKRTKAYKEWKKNFDAKNENKSKGLGDTIEKVTKATGIKKVVEFLAGEDCGCDERKTKLNELFSYGNPDCLNEDEYLLLDRIYNQKSSIVVANDVIKMTNTYNRIFKAKAKATSCDKCFVNDIYKPLKKIYEAYK